MTLPEISNLRLANQKIAATNFKTPRDLVAWMGAMQAQDYPMAKWAIGVRLLDSTDNTIQSAIDKGEIIRTHVMRPTWHFVSVEDIYWMLDLTASRILRSMKSRHNEMELSQAVFSKSNRIIEKALTKNKWLTRDELAKELGAKKIKIDENRLSHILVHAELNGIMCSGPIKNGKLTYALLSERVPVKKVPTREASLIELAKRYFTSHGPATILDFVWWSGLSISEAKQALEAIKTDFISETIGTETFWFTDARPIPGFGKTSVHLLPAYDEFLISYKDRSASLTLTNTPKAISNNGMFHPIIVVNGQVMGLWKRAVKKDTVIVEADFFQSPNKTDRRKIEEQAFKYGRFLNLDLELSPSKIVSKSLGHVGTPQ